VDGAQLVFVFLAVFSFLVLCVTAIWWLQSTVATRGRQANPDAAGSTGRLKELASEQRAAQRAVRVIAPVSAVAFLAALLASILSN
jgi:hypothetical protein